MAHYRRDPDEIMFDKLSKNKDLERGLQQIQANPTQDPVARQMAEIVLKECEKAKGRRKSRLVGVFIGGIIGLLLVIWKVSLNRAR